LFGNLTYQDSLLCSPARIPNEIQTNFVVLSTESVGNRQLISEKKLSLQNGMKQMKISDTELRNELHSN